MATYISDEEWKKIEEKREKLHSIDYDMVEADLDIEYEQQIWRPSPLSTYDKVKIGPEYVVKHSKRHNTYGYDVLTDIIVDMCNKANFKMTIKDRNGVEGELLSSVIKSKELIEKYKANNKSENTGILKDEAIDGYVRNVQNHMMLLANLFMGLKKHMSENTIIPDYSYLKIEETKGNTVDVLQTKTSVYNSYETALSGLTKGIGIVFGENKALAFTSTLNTIPNTWENKHDYVPFVQPNGSNKVERYGVPTNIPQQKYGEPAPNTQPRYGSQNPYGTQNPYGQQQEWYGKTKNPYEPTEDPFGSYGNSSGGLGR